MKEEHINLEDVKDLTINEMKQKMKDLEDVILRQYLQMTQCYVCPKCSICQNESTPKIALGRHDFPISNKSTKYPEDK